MSGTEDWIQYEIYCETEGAWQEWLLRDGAPAPTTCPNDTAHTVNLDSVNSDNDRREVNEVVLREETVKTGGNFQASTLTMLADAEATTSIDVTYPFDISAFGVRYVTAREHVGDTINLYGIPNPATVPSIGTITADVTTSDTVFSVQQSVVDNAFCGSVLTIFDGTNSDFCGRVNSVDRNGLTVTVETAPSHAYASATPSHIIVWKQLIRNFDVGFPWEYRIGESTIGASYVPSGSILRSTYTNRSPPLHVGQLSSDVAVSDVQINVSNDVFDALCHGDKVDLYDGTNTEPLGLVTRVDPSNGTITVETASTQAFAAATPTYVRKVAKKITAQIEINY